MVNEPLTLPPDRAVYNDQAGPIGLIDQLLDTIRPGHVAKAMTPKPEGGDHRFVKFS